MAEARSRIAEANEIFARACRDSGGVLTPASMELNRQGHRERAWGVLGLLRFDKLPLFENDHPDRDVVVDVGKWARDVGARWFFEQLGAALLIGVGRHSGHATALDTAERLERRRTRQHREADTALDASAAKIDQAERRLSSYPNRAALDPATKARAARVEKRAIRLIRAEERRIIRAADAPVATGAERRRQASLVQTLDDQVRTS